MNLLNCVESLLGVDISFIFQDIDLPRIPEDLNDIFVLNGKRYQNNSNDFHRFVIQYQKMRPYLLESINTDDIHHCHKLKERINYLENIVLLNVIHCEMIVFDCQKSLHESLLVNLYDTPDELLNRDYFYEKDRFSFVNYRFLHIWEALHSHKIQPILPLLETLSPTEFPIFDIEKTDFEYAASFPYPFSFEYFLSTEEEYLNDLTYLLSKLDQNNHLINQFENKSIELFFKVFDLIKPYKIEYIDFGVNALNGKCDFKFKIQLKPETNLIVNEAFLLNLTQEMRYKTN